MKDKIAEKLKNTNLAPFLFIGSGFSKRYLNSEDWYGLLKLFSMKATENEFDINLYHEEAKKNNKYGIMPKIASLLEERFNYSYFTKEKFEENRIKNLELIQNGNSPFKIELAEHFKKNNYNVENEEIKKLKKLAIRNVAGVITTNYDNLIESIFAGFETYVGQDELLFKHSYETGEIYKIHGCSSKPNSIVITEEDYHEFTTKKDYLVAKLLTIFIEHPIIFLGYSISDLNIQSIFSSIANSLSNDNLKILKERLIFVEWNNIPNTLEVSSHTIQFGHKNIEMTKLVLNDFNILYDVLLEHKPKYNPKVLRALKKDIYEMVYDLEAKEKVKVIGFFESDDYNNIETVMGVGVFKDLGQIGYSAIKIEELYRDIVLDDKCFESKSLINLRLPELLKQNSAGIPLYKYIKNYSDSLPKKINNLIEKNNSLDSFLNKSIRKNMLKQRQKIKSLSIKALSEKYGTFEAFKYIPYLKEDEIDLEELRIYLTTLIKELPNNFEGLNGKTELKRVIRIYDFLKFK